MHHEQLDIPYWRYLMCDELVTATRALHRVLYDKESEGPNNYTLVPSVPLPCWTRYCRPESYCPPLSCLQ